MSSPYFFRTRTVRDLRACACVSTPARVRVRVACLRLCQLRLCLGPLRLCLRLSLHLCACDPRKTCRASRPSLRLRGNAPSSRVPGRGTRSAGVRRSHHAVKKVRVDRRLGVRIINFIIGGLSCLSVRCAARDGTRANDARDPIRVAARFNASRFGGVVRSAPGRDPCL